MKNNREEINPKKVLITIIGMVLLLVFITNGKQLLKSTSEKTTVSEGSLAYEEPVEGFVIRDEVVLQGENYKNGMVRVLSDGERAAMNQTVFRYYSNTEDEILKQIADLDIKINEAINKQSNLNVLADVSSLEREIEYSINGTSSRV